jgi:hypothetical protein
MMGRQSAPEALFYKFGLRIVSLKITPCGSLTPY